MARELSRIQRFQIICVLSDPTHGRAEIYGDVEELEIAFGNLVKNAIDAVSTVPVDIRKLEVECCEGASGFQVKISDSGPGISPAHIRRLFDPWFTTRQNTGMGIGLYLTREILKRHDATVKAIGAPGKTTFEIIFKPYRSAQSS